MKVLGPVVTIILGLLGPTEVGCCRDGQAPKKQPAAGQTVGQSRPASRPVVPGSKPIRQEDAVMAARLIELLGNYRGQWENHPNDPVVYQRHAVALRRELTSLRDHLKTESGGSDHVSTARGAAAPVKPRSARPSIVRPPADGAAIHRQDERTDGTYRSPDPAEMKQRIDARGASRTAQVTVAERALEILGQIDQQASGPRPDREKLGRLFGDLKDVLSQLGKSRDGGPPAEPKRAPQGP